jgi:hypothetical protein
MSRDVTDRIFRPYMVSVDFFLDFRLAEKSNS